MATTSSKTLQQRPPAASKKVLITGVSKGLGRALALELASHGHTIIGCSRNQTKLDSLLFELSNSWPNRHMLLNVDVRSNSSVQEFAQVVAKKKLIPDIIVNNAALATRKCTMCEVDAEVVDNVIDTNVKGIANVIRHFIPLMIPSKQGIIVNISSIAGRNVFEGHAIYCASKWAVEGLSKSIAKELPEGLAMVTLDPGVTHTDMLALTLGDDDAASLFQSPQEWALKAAPVILDITATDNGASLTISHDGPILW